MNAANALSAGVRRHRLSTDDYHRMGEAGILAPGERVELIDGAIIDMTPIGPNHAAIVNRLNEILCAACAGRAIVSTQNPVLLSEFSEPGPDLALLRRREDFYTGALPRPADVFFVVEVADSTLAYDRDVKIPLYARHGIAEAWLIDVGGASLGVYREPADEGYRTRTTVDLHAVPLPMPEAGTDAEEVRVDLSGLF